VSQMGPESRPEQPTAMGTPMVLCPYCGSLSTLAKQCNICSGYFDLLSRQRSQNAMGPWFVRDLSKPFQPGCSYSTLVRMAQKGKIKPDTVLRGPSTRQFWSFARQTPGVANLLGECHACHKPVAPTSNACPNCKASFLVPDDRQVLGLSPVHLLPGDTDAQTIARSLSGAQTPAPLPPRAPDPVPVAEPEPEPVPIDNSPVPEPQVVVEEPKWIDEEPGASTGSRVGVVVAVLVVMGMMGGAGVWAWLHLSSRDAATAAEAAGTPAVVPQNEQVSQLPTDEPAAMSPIDTAEPEARIAAEDESEPASSQDDELVDAPERVLPTTQDRAGDAQRLIYDRILVGVADGSLDEADFEAQLAEVGSDQRSRLRRLFERRSAQIRLGRRGD